MLDAAYALLGNMDVDADLTINTPDGGRISLGRGEENRLLVRCDDDHALWELFDLLRQAGLVSIDAGSLKQLRNPMAQAIEVVVKDRTVILWPGKKLPQVKSWRGLLALLGHRRS